MVKKILALLLVLTMLAGCNIALADSNVKLTDLTHIHTYFGFDDDSGKTVYDHSQWKTTYYCNINKAATITANLYLNDTLFSPLQINGISGGTASVESGRVNFAWNGLDTNGWHPNEQDGTQTFLLKVFDENGNLLVSDTFTYTFGHDISQHTPINQSDYQWYPYNTLGLAGLPLRELDPDLTDKWYNIVPIDLRTEGTQVYDLVASNLFHIGKAYVTITDNNVTVDYALYNGHGYIKDECIAWFGAMSEITSEFLDNPQSDVAFGQPVSITDDLQGADTAILFICNKITYRQPYMDTTGYLTRYWPNLDKWICFREELSQLMEQLPQ